MPSSHEALGTIHPVLHSAPLWQSQRTEFGNTHAEQQQQSCNTVERSSTCQEKDHPQQQGYAIQQGIEDEHREGAFPIPDPREVHDLRVSSVSAFSSGDISVTHRQQQQVSSSVQQQHCYYNPLEQHGDDRYVNSQPQQYSETGNGVQFNPWMTALGGGNAVFTDILDKLSESA